MKYFFLFLGVATCAVTIVGIGIHARSARNKPTYHRVKVDFPLSFNLTSDKTLVDTVLYKYKDGDGSITDYETVGKPLVFRFPASYYNWSENQAGGPQGSITLSVDRFTMRPISELVHREYAGPRDVSPEHIYRKYNHNDLSISVKSQFVKSQVFRNISPNNLSDLRMRPIGKYCSFSMYGTIAGNADIESAERNLRDRGPDEYVIGESLKSGSWTGLHCSSLSPICIVTFFYRDYEASFHEQKGEVCRSLLDKNRIIRFLDQHVVAS